MQHLYNWFANHKTTSIVFFLGILFDVHFVSFRCEGAIFLDGNKTRVVSPGSDVEIKWTFDDELNKLIARVWTYATKDEELASIIRKGSVQKTNSTLSRVEFNEKGTMVLRNVDDSYNGTYSFQVSVTGSAGDISSVDVFVAGSLKMTVCSSPITANESSNVVCMCKAERDNYTPEPPSVAWYDNDGKQIGGVGKGMKELNLNNFKRNQAGRYTCKAGSYGLKQEKSIQVNVNYKPIVTKVEFTKKPRKSCDTATIECVADGQPEPTYKIIFGGRVISIEKKITFKVSDCLIGEYFCYATNVLGTDSKNTSLTHAKANSSETDGGTVVVWHIVISLVAGIIIGIILSYIVVWSRRHFGKRKPRSKPEPETPKDNSIYQDLDLRKMNAEDNYQSLRVNYAKNDAGPEQDSTYTELSKTREDENSYQTLT